MAYGEWLIGWLNDLEDLFSAKAQRSKVGSKPPFAPLRLCVKYFLMLLLVNTCVAQPRAPMRPADLVKIPTVTDAQISPNGQWVVYSVSSVDEDKNLNTLYLTRVDAR